MIPNPKHEHPAKIIRWKDADTVVLQVALDYFIVGTPLIHRMLWLDAPERYTDKGKAATKAVNELAPPGSWVVIRSYKPEGDEDNFGRWLAEVYVPNYMGDISINEYLLREGLADPYMQTPRTAAPDKGKAWVDMTAAAAEFGRAYAEFQNSIDRYVATDPYGRSADA